MGACSTPARSVLKQTCFEPSLKNSLVFKKKAIQKLSFGTQAKAKLFLVFLKYQNDKLLFFLFI